MFALFMLVTTPGISYSLNVHSSNVQKENIPVLNVVNDISNTNKDISQINSGQIRSRIVHIRNNIRQFLKRFDILGIF
jgi:hypothetical protein